MIVYRQTDSNHPFLWESHDRPEGRWHARGEGPVHYFATTPDGAWAEFLRHEEISDPGDLAGLRARSMWVVVLETPALARPELDDDTLTGGLETWEACQREAERHREAGSSGLIASSAALAARGAALYSVEGGEKAEAIDSHVVVLFGPRPDLRASLAAIGRPSPRVLENVRSL